MVRRLTALILALVTAAGLTLPASAADGGKRVYIRSAEDFLEFAENCTLDTWSQGKTVVLERDISLSGPGFQPISSFGGTFDGNGHTISGLTIERSTSPVGLFSQLQTGAVVRDLNVSGYVSPTGTRELVGGIAGICGGTIENCSFSGIVQGASDVGGIAGAVTETGQVRSSTAEGNISGETRTGGIAGKNLGSISRCVNESNVNTAVSDQSTGLGDLPNVTMERVKLQSAKTVNTASDTGGIAGYSSGSIYGCDNHAAVGYQHIGYNVGGIVGRSCGYLYSCENTGDVYGRKDVGGILGQAEPYIITNISQSMLAKLQAQIETLSGQVDQAIANAEADGDALLSRLEELVDDIEAAADSLGNIQTTINVSGSISGSGSASGGTSASVTPPGVDVEGEGSYDSSTSVDVTPPELPLEPPAVPEVPTLPDVDGMSYLGPGEGLTVVPLSAVSAVPLDMNVESSGGSSGSLEASGTPAEAEVSGNASASGEAYASAHATANTNLSGVSAAMSSIAGQLSVMNREAAGSSETVKSDVNGINAQVNAITDTIFDAINEAEADSDTVSDTSAVHINAVVYGKAKNCVNAGYVYGDLNVGGVAGSMSIEYEFDPENDVTENLSARYKREYELKAILQSCGNWGQVQSRKNYVGGLCGRMDLGLIYEGGSYGTVASENGSYVGGVAGLSSANIQHCFVKCSLSGGSCIGGVVGSGVTDSVAGSNSIVAQCCTLVEITESEQFAGAIAGCDAGTFLENYFVSDGLAGIDRLSRTGQAEPITYQQLMRVADIPEEFETFTLTFAAEDAVLESYEFSYGDSFDETVYPEIPQKDGNYANWDREELSELHFDTRVSVQYTPYVTALASQVQREDGRPAFLLEGEFTDVDMLTVESEPVNGSDFTGIALDFRAALKDYLGSLGEGPAGAIPKNVTEQWSIQIPEDGLDTHTLRYHPADGNVEDLEIRVWTNGEWERVESEPVGSYRMFDVDGKEVRIAVLSTASTWWMWLTVLAAAVVLVLLVLTLIRKLRKKRRKKPVAQPGPMAGAAADEAALLARVQAAEEMLAQAQQELTALKSGQNVPLAPDVPQEPAAGSEPPEMPEPEAPSKPSAKRPRKWIALTAVLLALAAALVLFLLFGTDIRESYDVARLLRDLSERKEVDMELLVRTETPNGSFETAIKLFRTGVEDQTISGVSQEGVTLYYAGDTVYLENGSAYRAGALAPDYTKLTGHLLDIYEATDIAQERPDGKSCYRVTAEGDDAETLLKLLAPAEAAELARAGAMEVSVWVADGAIDTVEFSGSGTLSDKNETELTVSGELEVLSGSHGHEIPAAVREALHSNDIKGEVKLTSDTLELLAAVQELCERDPFGADVQLSVNCGPVVLEDTLDLYRTEVNGTFISRIQKGDTGLYFAGDTVCGEDGKRVTAGGDTVNYANLLDAAYELCQGAGAGCTREGGVSTYEVAIAGEALEQVAYAIAPEAEALDVTLEQGTLRIILEDGTVRSLGFTCEGSIRIIAVDAEATIGCEIICKEARETAIPNQVVLSLCETG